MTIFDNYLTIYDKTFISIFDRKNQNTKYLNVLL